ncbi:MAG: phage tail tape measure protein [Dongiaceae bacterium]
MMANRTVSVTLKAQFGGYIAQAKAAQKATGDLSTQLAAAAKRGDLDELARGATVAGAALVGMAGLVIKRFADFDKAMSEVQAATHESAAGMEALRTAALQAGADTAYSAIEAAGAIRELAKAGVSTRDILGGGLKGALDLAAAGGLEVAAAAEIAAVAMKQFDLSGRDLPHVADLLAAAAGKAVGEVTDMGMALNQSALVANQFGLSIEETTGTLAAFAAAGLIGSDAGTSLKTMLLRLANPSGEAAKTMERLGIAAYDAQGNFVGLEALAGALREGLSGLTQAERDSALAIMFGNDAVRSANVLYSEGAEGIRTWTNDVDDAGYAAATAAARLNNLHGDLEKLGGSLETNLIKSGSGANAVLRGLTQGATEMSDAFGRVPTPVGATATVLTLLAGGILAAAGGAGMLIPKIIEARAQLEAIGPAGVRANKVMGGIAKWGTAASLASVALIGLGAVMHKVIGEVEDLDASKVRQALDDIARFGDRSFQATISKNAAGLHR